MSAMTRFMREDVSSDILTFHLGRRLRDLMIVPLFWFIYGAIDYLDYIVCWGHLSSIARFLTVLRRPFRSPAQGIAAKALNCYRSSVNKFQERSLGHCLEMTCASTWQKRGKDMEAGWSSIA